jgi:hypothetical protein
MLKCWIIIEILLKETVEVFKRSYNELNRLEEAIKCLDWVAKFPSKRILDFNIPSHHYYAERKQLFEASKHFSIVWEHLEESKRKLHFTVQYLEESKTSLWKCLR